MNPRQQKKLQTNRNILLLVLVFFLALLGKAVFKEPDASVSKIIGLLAICVVVAVVAGLNMYLERYLAKTGDTTTITQPPPPAVSGASQSPKPKSTWALLKAILRGQA